jgi:hypothetical protein
VAGTSFKYGVMVLDYPKQGEFQILKFKMLDPGMRRDDEKRKLGVKK